MKRRLVISAVNFTEGGPMTVLRHCLESASRTLSDNWEIIALVHNAELVGIDGIQYIEFPKAKKSWIQRLYFEFWKFNELSQQLNADYWLSLHDISPRVSTPRQSVYCHNPSPFYKPRLREVLWEPSFYLFCLFYRYLYRINIHANEYIIVQQDWIRQSFKSMYKLTDVVVAHPIENEPDFNKESTDIHQPKEKKPSDCKIFLYPALPRVFKNFEIACEAAANIYSNGHQNFELRLTISGHESRYARYIHQRFKHIPAIRFIGRQKSNEMIQQYQQATAVIFPSKLETWGLPISEAKIHGKPILLANLPYAHEALGGYDKVRFFDPDDQETLALLMRQHISDEIEYAETNDLKPINLFAPNWDKLLKILL
jgi:glycosyltransferase involved in cell wall biosynthesis